MKQTKKQISNHHQDLITELTQARASLVTTLSKIRDEGLLQFKVMDAPNSVWQDAPSNWVIDIDGESYRVTP